MRSIWAVATNTIAQAIRMKVAVIFIILLIVLLPLMAFIMSGDGTLMGKLQTFVSYGLTLTSLLLCLLTIIISVYTLSSDIKDKQIYTVLTKPIRRTQLLCGKVLGVIILDACLLALLSAAIFGLTLAIPKIANATEEEISLAQREFFTARASLKPVKTDVSKEVKQEYERLEKHGQLPPGMTRRSIMRLLTKQKELEEQVAGIGQSIKWEFYNVRPAAAAESLFLRYNYDVSVNPPDLKISGRWLIGDYRQKQFADKIVTPIYRHENRALIRTFHEVELPTEAIADDGYLAVVFTNPPVNDSAVIFTLEDGLEVLYRAGTFAGNFSRAVLLIFFRLVFLAFLSIFAATFLSFPVAILCCLMVFFTGMCSGFIIDSILYIGSGVSVVYDLIINPVIMLIPRFDKFNPTEFMVPARLIDYSMVAKAGLLMVVVKGFILAVASAIVFSFREIAKVIV